jgi:hypothetical protein
MNEATRQQKDFTLFDGQLQALASPELFECEQLLLHRLQRDYNNMRSHSCANDLEQLNTVFDRDSVVQEEPSVPQSQTKALGYNIKWAQAKGHIQLAWFHCSIAAECDAHDELSAHRTFWETDRSRQDGISNKHRLNDILLVVHQTSKSLSCNALVDTQSLRASAHTGSCCRVDTRGSRIATAHASCLEHL